MGTKIFTVEMRNREIIQRIKNGENPSEVALQYNVARITVLNIVDNFDCPSIYQIRRYRNHMKIKILWLLGLTVQQISIREDISYEESSIKNYRNRPIIYDDDIQLNPYTIKLSNKIIDVVKHVVYPGRYAVFYSKELSEINAKHLQIKRIGKDGRYCKTHTVRPRALQGGYIEILD